jgi:hypothetical protein
VELKKENREVKLKGRVKLIPLDELDINRLFDGFKLEYKNMTNGLFCKDLFSECSKDVIAKNALIRKNVCRKLFYIFKYIVIFIKKASTL